MTNAQRGRESARWLLAMVLASQAGAAAAVSFSLPWGEDGIEGVLNTTITAGVAVRTEERSESLVGKGNLDPNACGRTLDPRTGMLTTFYQSCQGLFRTQTFPAERLGEVPGQYTLNADDGNLNYDKGDIVQAPLKITQDLTLSYGNFGVFLKGLFFYDFVNNDFREYHPNRVTKDNYLQVGNETRNGTEVLFAPRTDSRQCPPERGADCYLVYGAGGVVRSKRKDGATLEQIGTNLQLLDAVVYGTLPLWDEQEMTVKLGRQALNWGESTLLVFGSLNQANPVNANNFFRTGFLVEEVFEPVGMLFLATEPFENATLEAFYQYQWEPLEAPAPGSYLSFIDLGTDNAVNHVNIGFGGGPEDPDQRARLLDNPLSGLTNTAPTGLRLKDNEPEDGGQYGLSFRYYAEWLNNGTELGLYFMNYHSRYPMVSMYSVTESCAKHTRSTPEFLEACPGIPLLVSGAPGYQAAGGPDSIQDGHDGRPNIGSAINFDSLKIQFEYPEDLKLFGVSFNTTAGDFSLQGEIAYRPDEPLQVDVEDLAFAAFGPTLSNCHIPDANGNGCAGTGSGTGLTFGALPQQARDAVLALGLTPAQFDQISQVGGVGIYQDPSSCAQVGGAPLLVDGAGGRRCVYPSSDYVIDAGGTQPGYKDTYDLLVGHMVGSARAFPSFVVPYRGGVIGTNPGSSYIRGWEEFDTYQFNLGGTYVAGATDNPIGADQILFLFETGATWVPDLPPLDRLQLEAPGTSLHASAGADGSGADRSRQACSTNPTCSYGGDGGRFNPHQQDLDGYPDKLSYGYVLITLIRYESILPGISLQPQIIWKHDVHGTSPGLTSNFVEGRKNAALIIETRYKSNLSFTAGYTWFTGGGDYNLNRDRDFAQAYVKYQF